MTQSNVVHYKRIVTRQKYPSNKNLFFDLEIFLALIQSFFHFNLINAFASLLFSLFGSLVAPICSVS